jgi:hypothetical protein
MNGSELDRRYEKQILREQLNREISEFLARGGRIDFLESHFRPTAKDKMAHESSWLGDDAGVYFQDAP